MSAPRLGLVLLLFLAATARAADSTRLPDLTADQTLLAKGKPVSTGKVYVLGGRVRAETTVGGMTITSIMDPAARKTWVLMPQPIGCLEQPIDENPGNALTMPAGADVKEELVGEETIDGHPTKKYAVQVFIKGRTYEHTQWRATDLDDFPIRTAAKDGSYEQRFSNVAFGQPAASLFETPTGCKLLKDVLPKGADNS